MTVRIQTAEKVLRNVQQQQVQLQRQMDARAVKQPPADKKPAVASVAAAAKAPPIEASEPEPGSGGAEDGEPEMSDEEREKQQQAELEEQNTLIGYNASTKKFARRWRPDFRCGVDRVPLLPDGEPVECDPTSESPCCSTMGWCGKSKAHCSCDLCVDYTGNVKIKVKGVHVVAERRECEEIGYSFGRQESHQACAQLLPEQVECGRNLMYSYSYPDWGCRCCAAGKAEYPEEKREWTVYGIDVEIVPVPAPAVTPPGGDDVST